jgi:acyl dehydratase
MPINPDALGASASLSQQVDTRWVLSYAAGLGLTDRLYLDDAQADGPFVVPMFCVCLEWEAALKTRNALLRLDEAELRRAVHVWQDSRFVSPIRAGMAVSTSSEVVHMRRTSAGTYVLIRYRSSERSSGTLLVDSLSGTMFRGVSIAGDHEVLGEDPRPRSTASAQGAVLADAVLADAVLAEYAMPIDAGLPHVYTECARIWNPIHTEERVARSAGLGGILLHGTATWAFAAKAIAQGLEGAEGLRRLRRLQGEFRRPVAPLETIRIRALRRDGDEIAFDVLTGSGHQAMSAGLASFMPA